MRVSLLCSVVSVFLASAAFAQGEGEFPATLKGHAVLPAQTFIDAPADAPDDLKTSGKYTTGRRVDAVGSVMGKSYERPTGVSLPFKGQPLQGHSGIKVMPDGSFWVLTDNGMGSRYNSADSMLYLNRHKIDWATGKIDRQETIFLHDPDKKVPFRILHEDTAKRYLTGADFDTPLNDGVLTFPFFTIENVDRIDDTHIIVGNDNNLPFSSSRDPNEADDNEFVLLEVGEFLKAK